MRRKSIALFATMCSKSNLFWDLGVEENKSTATPLALNIKDIIYKRFSLIEFNLNLNGKRLGKDF